MHRIRETERDGFPVFELSSPSELSATYAPGAGMVGCSLVHRGDELLGQRKGLASYARTGSTMGIPLLHPWANRLARPAYDLAGHSVSVPLSSPLVHDDGNGRPIHGLLGGYRHWKVVETRADADHAGLTAELDFGANPELLALFPFPHRLRIEIVLRDATLVTTTTLRAGEAAAVPVAFGYHPYFCLPDVPRAEWEVTLPVRRRAELDAGCLPTGQSVALETVVGPLGDQVFDDLYPELATDPCFCLAGGDRAIEVRFDAAYPVAVVYAPAEDDVICFEPMTAPTNPFEGGTDLRWVEAGEELAASFDITVR